MARTSRPQRKSTGGKASPQAARPKAVANPLPPPGCERSPTRYSPGTVALSLRSGVTRRAPSFLIPQNCPFQRSCFREIAKISRLIPLPVLCVMALQGSLRAYLVGLFEGHQLCAPSTPRDTIMPRTFSGQTYSWRNAP
ncbi:UNVERIFIED_CONTAM: hypothetical protein GTU68_002660 [Idotea baltica]|nr:hypothetical protein [Idotea baltica]